MYQSQYNVWLPSYFKLNTWDSIKLHHAFGIGALMELVNITFVILKNNLSDFTNNRIPHENVQILLSPKEQLKKI